MRRFLPLGVLLILPSLTLAATTTTKPLARQQWGAPLVEVHSDGGKWIIAGKRQTVSLDATNLATEIRAGESTWKLVPSSPTDLLVKSAGKEFPLRLADARKIDITRY